MLYNKSIDVGMKEKAMLFGKHFRKYYLKYGLFFLIGVFVLIAVDWLQGFAYSVGLEWWFFAIAGLSALLIAWITVGFQTLKASMVNPTECLRSE